MQNTVELMTLDGKTKEYPYYTVDTFPYDDLQATKMRDRRNSLCTTFGTFDIETTTINEPDYKFGFMYHWQLCVGGIVCVGRYWDDWIKFMRNLIEELEISENKRFYIFVHNLQFEYQFMKHFLSDIGELEVFAPQPRNPLSIRLSCGIEFRCSYKLTNMSLAAACKFEKGVEIGKQIGDLDYKKIRTPETIMTRKEIGYCVADVVSLYQMIECRLHNNHDTLLSIPMTSTGYVRRDCRNATKKADRYRDLFKSLRMTPEVYELCKYAARGGDTHANRYLAGRILRDIEAYDVQSSYPYVLMTKYYPMSKFTAYGDVETLRELDELCSQYCCLFTLIMEKPSCKPEIAMPYIPLDKCRNISRPVLDNGRVLEADYLAITITELDWAIIKKQYKYKQDGLWIADMHIAERGQLPKCIRDIILSYFVSKTRLKGELRKAKDARNEPLIHDLEYQYNKSKNLLNAIFGMMYTDPVREIITEDALTGLWKSERPDIAEALDKFYKNRNSFLSYPWGIWTTAHARYHLHKLVEICGQDTTAYSDTDSAYTLGDVEDAIETANEEIRKEAEKYGAYADYDGIRYHMGIYEHDKHCNRFKTMGAKKYAYEDKSGELHITVSGVAKEEGAREMGKLENFIPGWTWYKAGGMEMYYVEDKIHEITVNGCTFQTASSIAAVNGSYELGKTGEYFELIGYNLYNDIYGSYLEII